MNAEILAVSVDDLSNAGYAARALGFPFPVLYDVDADVVRAYGVLDSSGSDAVPSTFIIDTDGAVVWMHRGSTSHRTPNRHIIAQLEKLS